MNNFLNAYYKVMDYEGGYSFDKDDPGGETYKGISRVHNPGWDGWKIIDVFKKLSGFPFNLEKDLDLQDLVKSIYKQKYWDVFLGDALEPEIAEEMFDQVVNLGESTAIKNMQRAINILNNRGKLYPDIKIDGVFGGQTFTAYMDCIRTRGSNILFNVLNCYQAKRYIELMEASEIKEKYIGWFNRIEIKKL